ncbi:MAG: hypothetical protein ACI88Z_001147, partial [Sphingobacteriales bacterium]
MDEESMSLAMIVVIIVAKTYRTYRA